MRYLVLAFLATLGGTATVHADDVTACNPIGFPCFSVDRNSPVVSPVLRPSALLVGPPGPTVVRPGLFFGLGDFSDELDAVSLLNTSVDPTDTFLVLFSVDRRSRGVAPPDPNLSALGYPFNARNQAINTQHAADAFAGLNLFDRSGALPLPSAPLGGGGTLQTRSVGGGNNTLFVNQGDASGIDFALDPNISPAMATTGPQNNVDGMAGAESSASPFTLRASDGPHETASVIAFSVDAGSPSLPGLPGPPSGANIYLAADPSDPNIPIGGVVLYASFNALGLTQADEINALLVFDDGDFMYNPALDQVIFSLDRDSPSLNALPAQPGDLLTNDFLGDVQGYAQANQLGLGVSPGDPNGPIFDNIDALDFVLCNDRVGCLLDAAIGFPCGGCPGDVNGDKVVDLSDLAIVLANFGISGAALEDGDLDGDGMVTLSDLAIVLSNFGSGC